LLAFIIGYTNKKKWGIYVFLSTQEMSWQFCLIIVR
jgi:hypothetical protein